MQAGCVVFLFALGGLSFFFTVVYVFEQSPSYCDCLVIAEPTSGK